MKGGRRMRPLTRFPRQAQRRKSAADETHRAAPDQYLIEQP